MKRMTLSAQGAFTLAELLVAVSIISVLIVASLFTYNRVAARARDARRIADIQQIRIALEMFYRNEGHYPGFEEGISECGQYIGVGNSGIISCPPSSLPVPSTPQSIDHVLAPYMGGKVPKDPLHVEGDPNPRFYYAYDPDHMKSVSTGCSNVPGHPLFSETCNCNDAGGTDVVAVGFRQLESPDPGRGHIETCAGGHMGLSSAHYNTVFRPVPVEYEP